MNERRRRESSVLTSPVLIGALTVLVVIVAVVLAYGANSGLPFVPTYHLHVETANAEELAKGDDINEGGALVGIVGSVTPKRTRSGTPIAMLNLNLYKSVEPLPRDTTFTIRLKGAIGLKYLAVNRGTAAAGLPNGATVPLSQSSASVDFDQVLDMFTPATRTGVQDTTVGFGAALAGRGDDLNATIGSLRPLLDALQPVAANLAARRTDLAGFFRGLDAFTTALAPVAQAQGELFANLDTTFRAIAPAAPSLAATIQATPPAFTETIDDSPRIRSFLTDTALLLHQLAPGVATLRTSAPVLADAFQTGARTLPPTTEVDTQLVALADHLHSFGANAAVQGGLDQLTTTAHTLQRPIQFLAPVQTGCDYATLFFSNIANVLSEHVSNGTFLRFVPIAITDVLGDEAGPSHQAYTGKIDQSSGPIHSNPYPNTDSPGEPAECSAGHERYLDHADVGNPPVTSGLIPTPTVSVPSSK